VENGLGNKGSWNGNYSRRNNRGNTFDYNQPKIPTQKKRIVIKADQSSIHKQVQQRPSTQPKKMRFFEYKKLKKDQKEKEIKEKYFEMYKFKPEAVTIEATSALETAKKEEKKAKEFLPIINGLTQLQHHAKKVNQIKNFQSDILEKPQDKKITLLDSKIQKI
jgi:hypothetical protein